MFVGVIGDDDAGREVVCAAAEPSRCIEPASGRRSRRGRRRASCASCPSIISTHLLRADWEVASAGRRQDRSGADRAGARRAAAGRRGGAVRLCQGRADAARDPRGDRRARKKLGKPVIVDPKGSDYSIYRGATVITPNRKELGRGDAPRGRRRDAEIAAGRGASWPASVASEAVLVTRSEDGMMLHVARQASRCTCRPIRSRCATCRARATRSSPCSRVMLALGADFESRDARRQCRRRGRGRQARHRDRVGRRAARAHPAGRRRSRRKRRSCSTGAMLDERLAEWRAPGPAHRLHQWLLRSAASRPHQGAGRRRARPATGWWSASTATPR